MDQSWLTPRAIIAPAGRKGRGLFATAPIETGEVVTGFGGQVMTSVDFANLSIDHQTHSLQIAEDLFMVCPATSESADFFNHSCEPNLGIVGSVMLVAMQPIAAGDELTFDYAMCDADDYDEFECHCEAAGCRRKVTGNDWMIPELQERYAGFFSSYLERRIAALRAAPSTDHLL